MANRLLNIAEEYEAEALPKGARSLARIATIVVNRGSFFSSLKAGKTCTLSSFDQMIGYFADPANWPSGIPMKVQHELTTLSSVADLHNEAGSWHS